MLDPKTMASAAALVLAYAIATESNVWRMLSSSFFRLRVQPRLQMYGFDRTAVYEALDRRITPRKID
jgi:hypothetical protein